MMYQREYKQKLKVAMVGIGSHAYRNLLPTLNYLPVELCAVCNRSNEEILVNTARQYGCRHYMDSQKMFENEKLDAVFICTPASVQPHIAAQAFAAGVNVFVEKPPAENSEQILQMIKDRGSLVAVAGFKKAFMPATDKAIEIVNNPKYGVPDSILAVYPVKLPDNGKDILKNKEYTKWHKNSCHPLSFMLAVGGKVSYVTSHVGKNSGICIIEFENGIIGNLHLATGPQPNEMYNIYGNSWNIKIDNTTRVIFNRGIPFDYGHTESFISEGEDYGAILWEPQNCLATLENKALFIQGIYGEMKYFCDCILEKKVPERGSLEFALRVMKVCEAALFSEGKRVKIEEN